MFRVRLASGEEAVFRSVDELALGIQSGVISPEAMVFHSKVEQWLPITVHPEYAAARERAASLVATVDQEDLAPLPTVGELVHGGTVPVYQMVSQSARELAARKRPGWILPSATAVAGLILLVGVSLAVLPTADTSEEAIRLRDSSRSARNLPPLPPPGQAVEAGAALRMEPYNLANRLAQTGEVLSATFADSVRALGLGDLLALDRLRSQDSVAALLERLQEFRVLRAGFRTRALTVENAYQDSASRMLAAGRWTRAEMSEWRVRFTHLENMAGAARTESLIRGLEELYTLLNAERSRLVLEPSRAAFQRPEAAAAYERLRVSLAGYATITPAAGERFPISLALLVQGLRHSTLPPLSR